MQKKLEGDGRLRQSPACLPDRLRHCAMTLVSADALHLPWVTTPVSLSWWSPDGTPCASAEEKADALLVTALDEVAWFLNLRGSDVSYNPVFLSYVLLTKEDATLYVDQQKVRRRSPLPHTACWSAQWGSQQDVF